ncbi:MBOAT family protein [Candidatus Poribacteria bacterium]|nr:MBOAT family protein [Candidatus Poribacteria bacterium]
MVFSSHIFVYYFLPAALAAYFIAPRRVRHLVLTIASYVFYGWANPKFVFLMFASTLVDYACGLVIGRAAESLASSRIRHAAVAVSVVTNLSLLGFFKYFNFGLDNYNAFVSSLGLTAARWETALRVTLPLGISFYTFQSMSYTIDVYRGKAEPLTNFVDFACYVSMFPQLVAGPIIRFSSVADQLRNRSHTVAKFARGAALFSLGMSKKVLLANPCGKIADTAFGASSLTPLDAWYGAVGYAFQIYFDFSGYSDMAIGLGMLLGFGFPKNFDSPYRSASITEFWRRWHISLSTWLRDYLYIPLGGNRRGPVRTYVNLMVVMLLGGLWHGAAWTFVVWGALHGIALAVERTQGKRSLHRALPQPVRVVATFLVVLIGWVVFRSDSLGDSVRYLSTMVGVTPTQPAAYVVRAVLREPYLLMSFACAGVVVWTAPQALDWTERLSWLKAAACLALLWLSLAMLAVQAYNPFIYFIF